MTESVRFCCGIYFREMPELPDITVYTERIGALAGNQRLEDIRLVSAFLVRTALPPISSLKGLKLSSVERMGKRIVFAFEKDLFLVLHLMIAGRLDWKPSKAAIPKGKGLAALDFERGTLIITEAGTRKRASLHIVEGRQALHEIDPGGLEVLEHGFDRFRAVLLKENHTLKRGLTDPSLFSGIGNAYSDEILHRARLSPLKQTHSLSEDEIGRLFCAVKDVLTEWTQRIRAETGEGFPRHVTAFREGMAVHGRYQKPCPVCGTPVQRVRYAENETNYCPQCQTEGRLLADRALSRLLRKDWPRSLDEMEAMRSAHRCRGPGIDSRGGKR